MPEIQRADALTRRRAMVAAIAVALAGWAAFFVLQNWLAGLRGNDPVAWAMVPIALLLAWRHQANIRGLLQGRERTIGR